MDRETTLRLLRLQAPALKACGIAHAWLFGSVARGEATEQSDVDVLVELEPGDRRYRRYLQAVDVLQAALGRPVDVVMVDAVKPWAKEQVLAEAVLVA